MPAFARAGIREIEVASLSGGVIESSDLQIARTYNSYQQALETSRADLVYISTVNSLHVPLADEALRRGFHVVIDKPACLSWNDAQRLADLAASSERCLAEATVWAYHPQVRTAVELFQGTATHLLSAFSFPPLPGSDPRYSAELGGGAPNDVGPYALTPARYFFGQPAEEIVARILAEVNGVVTGFALLAMYPRARSLSGVFGFTTSYLNRLQVLGPSLGVSLDRVFSPPADLSLQLPVREDDRTRWIEFPPADTFELFLRDVFQAIARREYDEFRRTLLLDASEQESLRAALARSRQTA